MKRVEFQRKVDRLWFLGVMPSSAALLFALVGGNTFGIESLMLIASSSTMIPAFIGSLLFALKNADLVGGEHSIWRRTTAFVFFTTFGVAIMSAAIATTLNRLVSFEAPESRIFTVIEIRIGRGANVSFRDEQGREYKYLFNRRFGAENPEGTKLQFEVQRGLFGYEFFNWNAPYYGPSNSSFNTDASTMRRST